MILWEAERMKLDNRHYAVWIETGKGQGIVNAINGINYLYHDPREAARVWDAVLHEANAMIGEPFTIGMPRIIQANIPHAYGLLPVVIGISVIDKNPNRKGKLRGEMRLVVAHESEFDDVTVALTDPEAVLR
jgi:hypothetical protein